MTYEETIRRYPRLTIAIAHTGHRPLIEAAAIIASYHDTRTAETPPPAWIPEAITEASRAPARRRARRALQAQPNHWSIRGMIASRATTAGPPAAERHPPPRGSADAYQTRKAALAAYTAAREAGQPDAEARQAAEQIARNRGYTRTTAVGRHAADDYRQTHH